MSIVSFSFIAFSMLSALVFGILKGGVQRIYLFTLVNTLFIYSIADVYQIGFLAAFLALSYCLVLLNPWFANSGWFGPASVLGLTALFVVFKNYAFLSLIHLDFSLPFILGLSYIYFRCIQMIVDRNNRVIAEFIDPLTFFNFTCNFTTFVSGPIQRYQDFVLLQSKLGDFSLSQEKFKAVLQRATKGFFKAVVLADLALTLHEYLVPRLATYGDSGAIIYGVSSVVYLIYLYFNFSGYTDIVISAGNLFGLSLPENFDQPWKARNYLDFWKRWHISMGEWFNSYLFTPMTKAMYLRWKNPKHMPAYATISYLATFFLIGMWHGSTWAFVVTSIFWGAAAAVTQLYGELQKKFLSKNSRSTLTGNVTYLFACSSLTLSFVAISISGFWLDISDLNLIYQAHGAFGYIVAWLIGSIVLLPCIALTNRATKMTSNWSWISSNRIGIASIVTVMIIVYSFLYPAIDYTFVYQKF
jgi:alginate O-acetyltransferase complex protein AlgI